LGLVVPLPEPPQPAANNINNKANALTGTNTWTRRRRTTRRVSSEIPRIVSVSGHRSRWILLFGPKGGMPDVRTVVVMTKEAVEFAFTFTDGHAAPEGNTEQVRAYEIAPISVIVKVADDPADTVLEEGEALNDDGFPLETFRTVWPPKSEGPNGATMM
jgi:hypothetical protein